MAKLLKLRRGTTSQHSSFTGAEGEVTVDTDKETLVVHDGSTAGGHPVAAQDMGNVSSATILGRINTGSVVKAKLEADIIDGTKLADDAVNSEHYVDGSIDTAHIADLQVTTDKLASNAVTTVKILDANVTTAKIAADAITGAKIADDQINSEHYVDASIDHQHLSNDCIDGDNIQDDAVNSEHIAAGAVDLEHMSSESVDEDNLKISNSGSNGQFLSKQSGNTGGLTWATVDLSPYAPLASPALTGTATGVNLTLSGNLTVNGTTTTVATTNTTLTDNLLELNSGASSNTNDAGILIERGSTGDNAIIAWDESADKFTVGTTTGTASSTGNISITTGTLVANVEGNVTGNVTGNTSGSSGSCTGNAATATTATNADTVDNLHASNFLRSDANDSFSSGTLTITSTVDYPLTFNNSSNAKIDLKGSTAPYIRFREDTTEKAYIQWETAGHIKITNQEDSSTLRIKDSLDFTSDGGSNYYNVIHAGNVGSSGSLSSVTVYTSAIHDSKGNVRSIPQLNKTANYELMATEAGKHVTTTHNITVPNSVFSAGDAVTIINNSGSDITITQGSGVTVYNTADASSGNRTLAGRGMATILFTGASTAYISGAGLS